MQLLRGVWGAIPYANEFWLVELLDMISLSMEDWDPKFEILVEDISTVLSASQSTIGKTYPSPENEKIKNIQHLPGLYHEISINLQARSERRLLLTDLEDLGKGGKIETNDASLLTLRQQP